MSKTVQRSITITLVFLYFLWIRRGQPIFTDDINYLMLSSRFLIEGWQSWWYLPQCLGEITYEPILLWTPFALLRGVLGSGVLTSVFALDVFSVLRATTAVLLFFYLAARLLPRVTSGISLQRFAAAGMLLLGTIPAYLVVYRPELTLFILILISLLIRIDRNNQTQRWRRFEPFFHLLLFLWGITLHPQTATFLPFFVFVVIFCQTSTPVIRGAALALMLLGATQSVVAWGNLFECSAVPKIETFFRAWSVRPATLIEQPGSIQRMATLLLDLAKTPGFIEFYEDYPIRFLVNNRAAAGWLITLVNVLAISGLLLVAVTPCYFLASLRTSSRLNSMQRQQWYLALMLLLGLIIWAATRGKSTHHAPFIHGLCCLIYLLLVPLYQQEGVGIDFRNKLVRTIGGVLCLAAAVSVVLNAYLFGGFTFGYRPITPRASDSDVFVYRAPEMIAPNSIQPLLLECGINALPNEAPLAVDESTFFMLQNRPRLLMMLYIAHPRFRPAKTTLASLQLVGAAGYLLPCEDFPELEEIPHAREGALCCGTL